jgi:hypothetical protein
MLAGTAEHASLGILRERSHERRLADARLAADEDERTA